MPWVRGEYRLKLVTGWLGFNDLHCLSSFKIPKLRAYEEADVLHIHCLHGGFFNYLALPMLTRGMAAVYTLHDMWPFTGHCCSSFDCQRWKTGCGQCPYLQMPMAMSRDVSKWEWKLKDWSYRRSNLTVVAPSTWVQKVAGESMLSRFHIEHIPFGIETDVYRPQDRRISRAQLGISNDKKVLFYMARGMNPSDKVSHIKGADLLVRALKGLPATLKSEIILILAGEGCEAVAREVEVKTLCLGFISGDAQKAATYSAADLFVYPTRADTFGLVVLESLACGTPVVSFNVGGVPDLVRPGVTGALADPDNSEQLTSHIVELLSNEPLLARLRHQCREIVEKEYSLDLYVNRHIALYQRTLATLGT
jgi:glycosyltransferase involved in cell wall biosynthesis